MKLSVKLKVTIWYAVVMIVVTGVFFAAMQSSGRNMVKHESTQRLCNIVDEVAFRYGAPDSPDMKSLSGNEQIPPEMPHGTQMAPHHDFRMMERGVMVAVFDSDGNLLRGNIPYEGDSYEFTDKQVRTHVSDEGTFYEYDRKVETEEYGEIWIKGIVPVDNASYALKTVSNNNIIFAVILIILATIGGYFIINRSFVPIKKIIHTAKKINGGSDLTQRIALGDGTDEISELANTFDDMLARIEEMFEREKQFTSDASHELRTPVSVILSECEYMLECAKNEDELKESAQSIKNQAEKMSKLISELLTMSRMDRNTVALNFEDVDLTELTEFVCDEQEQIRGDGVTLKREIDADVSAKCDRFLIVRLLVNIISNAYQYTPEGGEITVSLTQRGNNIIFAVSDTGIGIAEKDLPNIWDRFYQADSARSGDNGSIGLGLSMVKWIAKAHNGDVTAESELGKGSTFRFKFPAK